MTVVLVLAAAFMLALPLALCARAAERAKPGSVLDAFHSHMEYGTPIVTRSRRPPFFDQDKQ